MWPLAFWDCGFESHRRQWCLSVVNVVYCQVELSASGWSLVRRSLPIVVCPSAIVKFRSWGDSGPLGAVALKDKSSSPKKKTLHSFLLSFHYFSTRIHNNRSVYHIYFHGPAFPSGPHHSVGFTITLKPTTHGRTPLEEWSVEQSELYLTTHSTHKRQDIRVPGEIRTRTPSNRATANPCIRPHGHWERLCHYNRRGFHISSWCQTVSSVLYQPSCCICLHPRDSVEVWCRQCFPAALQTDDKHSAADVTDMAKNLRRLFSYEVKNLMIFFFFWLILISWDEVGKSPCCSSGGALQTSCVCMVLWPFYPDDCWMDTNSSQCVLIRVFFALWFITHIWCDNIWHVFYCVIFVPPVTACNRSMKATVGKFQRVFKKDENITSITFLKFLVCIYFLSMNRNVHYHFVVLSIWRSGDRALW